MEIDTLNSTKKGVDPGASKVDHILALQCPKCDHLFKEIEVSSVAYGIMYAKCPNCDALLYDTISRSTEGDRGPESEVQSMAERIYIAACGQWCNEKEPDYSVYEIWPQALMCAEEYYNRKRWSCP